MPQWTWLVQFLLLGPFMLIIIGPVALTLVTAISQTGADGSSLLAPYTLMAFFTILLLIPLTPFAHRISYHIPTFFFLIFIATLAYSLLAFPFSAENRYKAYFQQTIDLESGENIVTLGGIEEYIRPIIATLPSASGQPIKCATRPARTGLQYCTYKGLAPKVVGDDKDDTTTISSTSALKNWIDFNISRTASHPTTLATFSLHAPETRACVLRFSTFIRDFTIHSPHASTDPRFPKVSEGKSYEIRLWRRDWTQPWQGDVEWSEADEKPIQGKAVCLWSDDNVEGVIPALDEVRRFAPVWSAVTKLGDGLVEGMRKFEV